MENKANHTTLKHDWTHPGHGSRYGSLTLGYSRISTSGIGFLEPRLRLLRLNALVEDDNLLFLAKQNNELK